MAEGSLNARLRLKARIAGALWLVVIAAGGAAVFVRSTLIDRNDAASTALKVISSEPLFRFGLAADLVGGACYVGVTVLLYELLMPAGGSIVLLATLFGVGGVLIGAATSIASFAPLLLLAGGPSGTGFTTNQLQTLALLFLRLHGQGYNISMIFFGLQCLLLGGLFLQATLLPRIISVLLAMGGLSYVISSFTAILAPELSMHLSPYILPIALAGEGSVAMWLLAMGVPFRLGYDGRSQLVT